MAKEKQSFIIYKDWNELLLTLNDEQTGRLFKGIFDYQCNGNLPDFEDDLQIKGIFSFFRKSFINDNEKYEETCKKNSENGKKGGRPKQTNGNKKTEKTERLFKKPKKADNDNDKDKDKEYDYDNDYDLPVSDEPKTKKQTKHKYGNFKNVLLTDTDIENLKQKFPDCYQEKIENLSEGIELKDYKYKNHYLAILKWEQNRIPKRKDEPKNNFAGYDIDKFEEMLNRDD